jgi:CubicO group peptidase (beta-lactamase class C family)
VGRYIARDPSEPCRSYIDAWAETGLFSGVAVVVGPCGSILTHPVGMADINRRVPNGPRTRFPLGSVSKLFTALAIMQLQDDGQLDIGAPATTWLGEGGTDRAQTLQELLTHTRDPGNAESAGPSKHVFHYSNAGYMLLAEVIERVSGLSYPEYIQRHIFTPLGMQESGCACPGPGVEVGAVGYRREGDGLVPAARTAAHATGGAGALSSTAEDLLRWDRGLYEPDILRPKRQGSADPSRAGAGYGWMVSRLFGRRHCWHDGHLPGFNTWVSRFPDERISVLLLSNLDHAWLRDMSAGLAALVFGQSIEWPSLRLATSPGSAALQTYAGSYSAGTGFRFRIVREADRLFFEASDQPRTELRESTEGGLIAPLVNIEIDFVRDAAGSVRHVLLHQDGQHLLARRTAHPPNSK